MLCAVPHEHYTALSYVLVCMITEQPRHGFFECINNVFMCTVAFMYDRSVRTQVKCTRHLLSNDALVRWVVLLSSRKATA